MNDTTKKEIVEILKGNGRTKSTIKAKELEMSSFVLTHLHLVDLELTASEIRSILEAIKNDEELRYMESVSFSKNPLFGDKGATALSKIEFTALNEIEIADCGITDKGGAAILSLIKKMQQPVKISFEGNKISDALRAKFEKLAS